MDDATAEGIDEKHPRELGIVRDLGFFRDLAVHFGIPALLGCCLLGLYYVPKDLFGCLNRGLVGLGLCALALGGAIASLVLAVRVRRADPAASHRRLLAAALYLLPLLLVVAIELALAR
jgi:hypothetical protein